MDRITPEALYQATVHWLWVALLEEETANEKEKKKKRDPSGFVSHLEAFKECKWISIHFPVYKNQVVLTELLNCWTKQCTFFFFKFPFRRGCLCWEGGLQACFVPLGGKKSVCHLPEPRGALRGWGLVGGSEAASCTHARVHAVSLAWGCLFIFKAFVPQVTCKAGARGVQLKLGCVYSPICS